MTYYPPHCLKLSSFKVKLADGSVNVSGLSLCAHRLYFYWEVINSRQTSVVYFFNNVISVSVCCFNFVFWLFLLVFTRSQFCFYLVTLLLFLKQNEEVEDAVCVVIFCKKTQQMSFVVGILFCPERLWEHFSFLSTLPFCLTNKEEENVSI